MRLLLIGDFLLCPDIFFQQKFSAQNLVLYEITFSGTLKGFFLWKSAYFVPGPPTPLPVKVAIVIICILLCVNFCSRMCHWHIMDKNIQHRIELVSWFYSNTSSSKHIMVTAKYFFTGNYTPPILYNRGTYTLDFSRKTTPF